MRPQLHGEPAEAPAEVRGKKKDSNSSGVPLKWEFLVGKIWSILGWEELNKNHTYRIFEVIFEILEKKMTWVAGEETNNNLVCGCGVRFPNFDAATFDSPHWSIWNWSELMDKVMSERHIRSWRRCSRTKWCSCSNSRQHAVRSAWWRDRNNLKLP